MKYQFSPTRTRTVAVVAEDLRSAQIDLQDVLDDHRRRLQLVAVVVMSGMPPVLMPVKFVSQRR
jgi:hypothetical protein